MKWTQLLSLGDVRKVEYSTEMGAVEVAPQNRDEKCPSEDQQLELNRLRPDRAWPDLKLPSPKCTQSHSQSRKGDYQKVNEEKRDARPDKRDQMDRSYHAVNVCPKSVISLEAQKEAEQKTLAADKSAPEEEEDWDADPPQPPQETPQGLALWHPLRKTSGSRCSTRIPVQDQSLVI